MGPYGATCDYTFTERPRDVAKPQWDEMRVGMLCVKSDLFANWKAALIKFCNDTKRCTYEEEEAVKKVGKKIDALAKRAKIASEEE